MQVNHWHRARCAKLRSTSAGMQTRNSATRLILMHAKTYQTDGLHERLCDLGDFSMGSEEADPCSLEGGRNPDQPQLVPVP